MYKIAIAIALAAILAFSTVEVDACLVGTDGRCQYDKKKATPPTKTDAEKKEEKQ